MTRVRVATVNDNFGNKASNLPLAARVSDVMLTQESKNDNVRKILGNRWHVHQVMRDAGRRGSAVCWAKGGPFRAGSTDQIPLVKGRGLLPRYATIVHGRVGVVPVTFIATHRPPGRFRRLWSRYDRKLAAYCRLLRSKGREVIVGLDANQRHPYSLARRCGLRWAAPSRSIDGFLLSPGIGARPPKVLPKWTSDHHPILIWLDVKQPKESHHG